jgi:hypothetical protein
MEDRFRLPSTWWRALTGEFAAKTESFFLLSVVFGDFNLYVYKNW